jgi:hypothetical protein
MGRRGTKPATNRLSYGAAYILTIRKQTKEINQNGSNWAIYFLQSASSNNRETLSLVAAP